MQCFQGGEDLKTILTERTVGYEMNGQWGWNVGLCGVDVAEPQEEEERKGDREGAV